MEMLSRHVARCRATTLGFYSNRVAPCRSMSRDRIFFFFFGPPQTVEWIGHNAGP
jgi:hypothetical protein